MAETDAQKSRRRNRVDSRDEQGTTVAYQNEGGQELVWTGDDEAPYVKVVNESDDPVVISPVSGTPTVFYRSTAAQQVTIAIGELHVRQIRAALAPAVITDRFLMIFDAAVPVINGAVPVWQALVPGGLTTATTHAEAGDDFEPIGGLPLTTGFVLASSTTIGTLTLSGVNDTYFEATYTVD